MYCHRSAKSSNSFPLNHPNISVVVKQLAVWQCRDFGGHFSWCLVRINNVDDFNDNGAWPCHLQCWLLIFTLIGYSTPLRLQNSKFFYFSNFFLSRTPGIPGSCKKTVAAHSYFVFKALCAHWFGQEKTLSWFGSHASSSCGGLLEPRKCEPRTWRVFYWANLHWIAMTPPI